VLLQELLVGFSPIQPWLPGSLLERRLAVEALLELELFDAGLTSGVLDRVEAFFLRAAAA
jgi:hypothetical protein